LDEKGKKTQCDWPHRGQRSRPDGAGSPSKPINVFDNETKVTYTYESISEAARILGIKKPIISRYIQNNQKKPYKSRFVFKKL